MKKNREAAASRYKRFAYVLTHILPETLNSIRKIKETVLKIGLVSNG